MTMTYRPPAQPPTKAKTPIIYESIQSQNEEGCTFKEFYDEHTLFIENNGNSDNRVLDLLDAVIRTHPNFENEFPGNSYQRYEQYTPVHVHSQADSAKNIEFRDRTYVFIYNHVLYRYIIMRDSATGLNKERVPLSPEDVLLRNEDYQKHKDAALKSWADDADSTDFLDHKYEVKTYPYLVAGVSVFDDDKRGKHWKDFLTHENDIAIMRGKVKEVRAGLIPNKLIIRNIPSVKITEDAAIAIAKRYGTTEVKRDPATKTNRETHIEVTYKTYMDKKTNKPRAEMDITYDKNTMDASFAFTFFRYMRIAVITGGVTEFIPLTCEYAKVGGSGGRRGGMSGGGRGARRH